MVKTEKTEEEQIAFFQECLSRYEAAETNAGHSRHYFQVAGTAVCLCFAGETMVSLLTSALEHLRIPACESPELTLYIWDSESTGVQMVPPPCDRHCFTDRGDIWGFNSRRIKTAFHWIENSVNLMDLEKNIGIFWVQTIQSLPFWGARFTAAHPVSLVDGKKRVSASACRRCRDRARCRDDCGQRRCRKIDHRTGMPESRDFSTSPMTILSSGRIPAQRFTVCTARQS